MLPGGGRTRAGWRIGQWPRMILTDVLAGHPSLGRGAALKGRSMSSVLSWPGFRAACGKSGKVLGRKLALRVEEGPAVNADVRILSCCPETRAVGRIPAHTLSSVDSGRRRGAAPKPASP